MLLVLGDRALSEYTGGAPPSLDELRTRYTTQVAGTSPDGARGWLNWIVREREHRAVVGAVQATLSMAEGDLVAEGAWLVGTRYQRHGYATEAAEAMLVWLARHGVVAFAAYINPRHAASIGVARRLELTATGAVVDSETRWARRRP
jgi:RimJ/RimL family protein N-acetyltransferase